MDLSKTGSLIYNLRREKGFTQKQVAEKLGVCAKTVSKWETGHGFPDVGLICKLSDIFGINIEKLLEGEIIESETEAGNMKRTKFYVCEKCGSILTSVGNAEISCCGRKLKPLSANVSDEMHKPNIEETENDYYITFSHPMEKEHYISFVAYVRFDRVLMVRLYPEQGAELRMPQMRGGKLYFYCVRDGLFEMRI